MNKILQKIKEFRILWFTIIDIVVFYFMIYSPIKNILNSDNKDIYILLLGSIIFTFTIHIHSIFLKVIIPSFRVIYPDDERDVKAILNNIARSKINLIVGIIGIVIFLFIFPYYVAYLCSINSNVKTTEWNFVAFFIFFAWCGSESLHRASDHIKCKYFNK
jgi:hypothetical protein